MVSASKLRGLHGEDKLVAVIKAGAPKRKRAESLMGIQPVGQRDVAIWYLFNAQVENGGFNQFFWNTECELNDPLLEALERVGSKEVLPLLREAVAKYKAAWPELKPLRATNSVHDFASSYEICPLRDLSEKYYDVEEDVQELFVDDIGARPELYADPSWLDRLTSRFG